MVEGKLQVISHLWANVKYHRTKVLNMSIDNNTGIWMLQGFHETQKKILFLLSARKYTFAHKCDSSFKPTDLTVGRLL